MVMHKPHISKAKAAEVERLTELVGRYNVIGLARISKVPAKALHGLRDTLRGDVVITMSKKKLILKAFEAAGKNNLQHLAEEIDGITALLFTDMNPIKLAQFLESKAVKGPAKPGDIAPMEIIVKAGDTKIAPGPIISELNQNLKAPTMIKNGTVHIRNDTVTHKVGDLIDAKQAQLLARLGVEPMTIKLDFYSAWEDGEIIPEAVLHLDMEEILGNVQLAASQALNLALGIGMITSETVEPMIAKAYRSAVAVALELPIIIPDLVDQYLAKATRIANAVNASALGLEVAPVVEESAAEPEKEEEKEEEEEPAGLGALFG
ncbi:50S ribosomal protein L10 [Candidatus Lokiarchaeum ossiferum]|uniref:50S ribosomal protein L10 n=1 Tax=Candidatus Lokiarchaeum ossiferum TaxID=2951803 RepID=UPI00352E152B